MRKDLSVVTPCYNEEKVIGQFIERTATVLRNLNLSFELIFVNDGSSDSTLAILKDYADKIPEIIILNLSRNFGHQAAVTAGLDNSVGDAVVIIDADLQDPPEVISDMYAKWKDGFDIVYGQRMSREGETIFKKSSAKLFYRLFRFLTNDNVPLDTGDFRLVDRKVVEQIGNLRESHRFLRGLFSWVGFRQYPLKYDRKSRVAGETHYPLKKMLVFSIDAIISFSIIPLRLFTILGAVTILFTLAIVGVILFTRIYNPSYFIPGFSATVVLILLFGGIQLFATGIIGEYIGRIYEETKKRPIYIIRDIIGRSDHAV